jgi:hypothetical protein
MTKRPSKAVKSKRMVSQAAFAKRVDLSRQRVVQFVTEGTFPADADGRIDEDACIIIYVRWLRGEGRKSAKTAATSRLQDVKVREIELRVAKELREVIPVEDVCDFLTETVGMFRSELAGVPAASTRDPEARAVIENNIDGAIVRLRGKFDAGKSSLRARKPLISEDGDGHEDD